jgi:hypothetical protein
VRVLEVDGAQRYDKRDTIWCECWKWMVHRGTTKGTHLTKHG